MKRSLIRTLRRLTTFQTEAHPTVQVDGQMLMVVMYVAIIIYSGSIFPLLRSARLTAKGQAAAQGSAATS
jgi:hypothetical protein